VRKANFDIFKILFLKLNNIKTIHGIKLNFLGINHRFLFYEAGNLAMLFKNGALAFSLLPFLE